jgi:hypothetical protein
LPGEASFQQLKAGLVQRFVGQNAFELTCAELEGKVLTNFPGFDSFKAWFVQTVAAMKAFAPSERMWTDTVLIDKLLLCLRGTLYYEGVVADPITRLRPNTLTDALCLLDKQHEVLLMRAQAYEGKGKAPMVPTYADKVKAPAAGAGTKRASEAEPSPSGSGAQHAGAAKKAKKDRLPLMQWLLELHGLRDQRAVKAHIEDSRARPPVPLKCPLCSKDHFITKCESHKRVVKARKSAHRGEN